MKTLSRISLLIAGVLAIASTGCTVVGVGTIPSAVEGSNQNMEFTADFAYDNDLEEVSGTGTFVDCAAGVNVSASFSTEDVIACNNLLSDVDGLQNFLGDSLAECLGVDNINLETEQVAIILGRYELRGCHPGKALGHTKGKGHTSHGNGKGKGHDKGHGDKAGDGEVIGTGCLIAIYVDCEEEGCIGDGLAVALVDDNDPENVLYTNCGILNSGDITVDYDFEGGGVIAVDSGTAE